MPGIASLLYSLALLTHSSLSLHLTLFVTFSLYPMYHMMSNLYYSNFIIYTYTYIDINRKKERVCLPFLANEDIDT